MENAVSALKIAMAVFVFMLGLVILFSMATQARDTSDILISGIDKTNYYTYLEIKDVDANGNRIVSINDIIPVLYRYAEENYGVTIVDNNGNIVARFDLDTEAACNNWNSFSKYSKYKFISETNNIYRKVNIMANKIDGKTVNLINLKVSPANPTEDTSITSLTEAMTYIFRNIYKQTKGKDYYCRWLGSLNWTAQRIDSDLSRKNC